MMPVTATPTLLQDAAEWHLLGLLFQCPRGEWFELVRALSQEVADPRLQRAAALAAEASEGAYHSIFGPGGPAPPREVSYLESVQLGYLLSELEIFYDAFAYPGAGEEAADHVAVEANFIAYLKLKEAYAIAASRSEEEDDLEQAATTAQAIQEFIAAHLSNIAEPLARSLAASGVEYLELAGASLLARVGPARKCPGLAPNPLPVLTGEPDEDLTCGEAH